MVFQSTLPLRGATPVCDRYRSSVSISIHAPLAGSDHCHIPSSLVSWLFQSTLPLRGATSKRSNISHVSKNFNPRSPCGERRWSTGQCSDTGNFNPRSPCGERPDCAHWRHCAAYFNPRSPCGERLPKFRKRKWRRNISIHAPLAGSDWLCRTGMASVRLFQSTLPLRGATPFGNQDTTSE